jgi:hypothetical protein
MHYLVFCFKLRYLPDAGISVVPLVGDFAQTPCAQGGFRPRAEMPYFQRFCFMEMRSAC